MSDEKSNNANDAAQQRGSERDAMRKRHLALIDQANNQNYGPGPDHSQPPEVQALRLNNSLLAAMLEAMTAHG